MLLQIFSREENWIASGAFDRTVKLWDLGSNTKSPIATLNLPDTMAPKSSIYALAVDPFGQIIASGSPERVIRLWDPRTGKKIGDLPNCTTLCIRLRVRTGKLVGHTDNIRAMIISADSKYVSRFDSLAKSSVDRDLAPDGVGGWCVIFSLVISIMLISR